MTADKRDQFPRPDQQPDKMVAKPVLTLRRMADSQPDPQPVIKAPVNSRHHAGEFDRQSPINGRRCLAKLPPARCHAGGAPGQHDNREMPLAEMPPTDPTPNRHPCRHHRHHGHRERNPACHRSKGGSKRNAGHHRHDIDKDAAFRNKCDRGWRDDCFPSPLGWALLRMRAESGQAGTGDDRAPLLSVIIAHKPNSEALTDHECRHPFCPVTDRIPAYWRGTDGAVQLAVRAPPWRQLSAADRGHRPGPVDSRGDRRHS